MPAVMPALTKLGNSDLMVPMLCLGTMTWGQQNTEEEAHAQMDHILEAHGIVFIDTAELYPVPPKLETCGRTEDYIGTWLETRKCRDKVILATKVCGPFMHAHVVANRTVPQADTATCGATSLDEASIRAALDSSLRRMKTDYIDLYQIHWPSRYAPVFGARQYKKVNERPCHSFEEQVKVMAALITEGKIKHWGVSNETTYGMTMMYETAKRLGLPLPVSIQNDFSLVARGFEEELAEACSPLHCNIGLLSYGALAGGTLSGKYLNGAACPTSRHTLFAGFQARYICEATSAATALYAKLAASKGLTPTQLALGWAAGRWYQSSIIIGATTMPQLIDNIAALEVVLDEETLVEIDRIHLLARNPNYTD
ncbi:MAG: hypothetical protein WDW36_003094 [Sanguina aurantia]